MLRIFNKYYPPRNIVFFFIEGFIIFGSVVIAAFLRFDGDLDRLINYDPIFFKALIVTIVCQVCLYYNELYDFKITSSNVELGIRLTQAVGASYLILALIYFFFPELILGRGIFLINLLFLIGFIASWRLLYNWILKTKRFDEKILVVGVGDLAGKLTREIVSKKDSGFEVVGFIANDSQMVGKEIAGRKIIGCYDQIPELVKKNKINEIVVALEERRGKYPLDILLECKMKGIEILEGTSFFERIAGKILVESLSPSWLIFSDGFKKSEISKTLKRITGAAISALGLILTLPLFIITAILIKIDSRGPVFFTQERVGENGKIFKILKFRSMIQNAEAEGRAVWAEKNDARITRIGNIIRKLRIDEVPQIINVLKGEMSFVGPRPERPQFVTELEKKIPYYSQRHSVKPGITGWAQVCYPYGSTVEDAQEKLEYDLYYAKNISTLLDLKIIFMTIKVILLRKGSR